MVCDVETQIYIDFFKAISFQPSGSRTETRKLAMSMHEVNHTLYSEFPSLLRNYARENPFYLHQIDVEKKKPSRFIQGMLDAVSKEDEWASMDEVKRHTQAEKETRYKQAVHLYQIYLAKKRAGCSRTAIEALESDSTELTVKYCGYAQPVSPSTFWAIIRKEFRFSTKVHPHHCVIHDTGPSLEAALTNVATCLQEANANLERLEIEIKNSLRATEGSEVEGPNVQVLIEKKAEQKKLAESLMRKQRDLYNDVQKYRTHLRQFEKCRPLVKEVQDNLKPGECLIYRDFVNQYTSDGKCINLVLVLLWRERELQELNILKIHNVCTDRIHGGADSYFVAAVFKHHLESALFERFHTIFISGDHGPHFTSAQTIYNESTFYPKYGKKIVCLFLCSYHAYNRCDSAGVEAKRILQQMAKKNEETNYSGVIAALINQSSYENAVAVPFEQIPRTPDTFPTNLVTNGANLRFYCELRYEYRDENDTIQHEEGIVLARKVPGIQE
jgi:hypothetical protein